MKSRVYELYVLLRLLNASSLVSDMQQSQSSGEAFHPEGAFCPTLPYDVYKH